MAKSSNCSVFGPHFPEIQPVSPV
uniref:Uncharacterized protein n=1 Tax=Anguilla anguilla TaxID=7936 RepID=A0A0E9PB00_ANGAN